MQRGHTQKTSAEVRQWAFVEQDLNDPESIFSDELTLFLNVKSAFMTLLAGQENRCKALWVSMIKVKKSLPSRFLYFIEIPFQDGCVSILCHHMQRVVCCSLPGKHDLLKCVCIAGGIVNFFQLRFHLHIRVYHCVFTHWQKREFVDWNWRLLLSAAIHLKF